jgi:hypothetical protein
VGVTAGSREVPGRKPVTRDNSDDDGDDDDDDIIIIIIIYHHHHLHVTFFEAIQNYISP